MGTANSSQMLIPISSQMLTQKTNFDSQIRPSKLKIISVLLQKANAEGDELRNRGKISQNDFTLEELAVYDLISKGL